MKNVSKLLSILLCLAMFMGIFAMTVSAAAGDTFTKVTSVSEITAGGEFVIVAAAVPNANSSSKYALPSINSNTKPVGTEVTSLISGNTLRADANTPVITIAAVDSTSVTLKAAKFICGKDATDLVAEATAPTDGAQAWTVTENGTTDTFEFNNVKTSARSLALNDSNKFGGYAVSNKSGNNAPKYNFFFEVYKKGTGGAPAPTVNVTGVTLDKTTATVEAGMSVTLAATVAPNNATNKAVTWTSSNNAVATVSNGKVTGVKAGTATITAKTEDGNKTATCTVTVTARPTIADGQYIIWNAGNNKALSSNPSQEGSFYNGGVDVTLSGGKLTGYGATEIWTVTNNADGTITIATQDGKKLSMDTGFSSTPFDKVNDKWALNTAAEGQYYIVNVGRAGQTLQWRAGTYNYFSCYTSPNVESYGMTFTKYTPPAVLVPATSVTLNETSGTLEVDETITLTATVAPSNTTDTLITWTSSDESVATVSNGKVKALKAGTATITAKAGDKTATFALTVTAPTVPTGAIDSLDKLVTGTYVLVVDTGYAPTVLDGTWFMSAQPTIAEGKVSDAKGTVLKLVVKDGKATIKDANGKIFATGKKNEAGTADAFEWDVKFENNRFTFTSGEGDDTRYLASAISYDNKFRTYKASTFAGNPEGYAYKFSIYAAEAPAGDKTPSQTGDTFEPMVIVLALAAVSALAVLALNKKKFSF